MVWVRRSWKDSNYYTIHRSILRRNKGDLPEPSFWKSVSKQRIVYGQPNLLFKSKVDQFENWKQTLKTFLEHSCSHNLFERIYRKEFRKEFHQQSTWGGTWSTNYFKQHDCVYNWVFRYFSSHTYSCYLLSSRISRNKKETDRLDKMSFQVCWWDY